MVEHFSRAIWWSVVTAAGFDEIDEDSDGTITRDELSDALKKFYGHGMGDLVLDNLMAVADVNDDGAIDRSELLQACFVSATLFIGADADGDGNLTMEEVSAMFAKVLGAKAMEDMGAIVSDLFQRMDADHTGTVSIAEVKAFAKDGLTSLKI